MKYSKGIIFLGYAMMFVHIVNLILVILSGKLITIFDSDRIYLSIVVFVSYMLFNNIWLQDLLKKILFVESKYPSEVKFSIDGVIINNSKTIFDHDNDFSSLVVISVIYILVTTIPGVVFLFNDVQGNIDFYTYMTYLSVITIYIPINEIKRGYWLKNMVFLDDFMISDEYLTGNLSYRGITLECWYDRRICNSYDANQILVDWHDEVIVGNHNQYLEKQEKKEMKEKELKAKL